MAQTTTISNKPSSAAASEIKRDEAVALIADGLRQALKPGIQTCDHAVQQILHGQEALAQQIDRLSFGTVGTRTICVCVAVSRCMYAYIFQLNSINGCLFV